MIVFAFPNHKQTATRLLKNKGYKAGVFSVNRYQSGELYLKIKTKVLNQTCLIIGDTATPDSNILELLMLAYTLRQEGARKIIALIPYLGYSRQEHLIQNVARNTYLMGYILKAAGVNELITIDLHNPKIERDFPIKIINLPARPIFKSIINKFADEDITLVAPDQGAIKRCEDLHMTWPIAYFQKKRLGKIIKIHEVKGSISPNIIIYDDILSTGETLVQAVKKLKNLGAAHITIVITHGQFYTKAWRQLLKEPVDTIYVSDTCHEALSIKEPKIKVLPSFPAIESYFKYYS